PAPVVPLRVAAVAGADLERERGLRLELDDRVPAAPVGEVDAGGCHLTGAGPVVHLEPRPPELLDRAVGIDAHRIVEGAEPLAVLLGYEDDGEIVEPQGAVDPPESAGPQLLHAPQGIRV